MKYSVRLAERAVLYVLLWGFPLLAGCGSRAICARGTAGAIEAACVESHCKPGDKIALRMGDGSVRLGQFMMVEGLGDEAAVVITTDPPRIGEGLGRMSVSLEQIESVSARGPNPHVQAVKTVAEIGVTAWLVLRLIMSGISIGD